MKKFYEYLLGINENWLMINEEGNICTAEMQYELPYCHTEWYGIFNVNGLQKNVCYSIKSLIEKCK